MQPGIWQPGCAASYSAHDWKFSATGLVQPASSYLSSSDPRVHFGLGDVDRVTSIEVDWPDGTREVFSGGDADRIVTVSKGTGQEPGQ